MEKQIIAKKEFIDQKLKSLLSGFESRRQYNRKKTFVNHILIVVLGGLVTFSNGLQGFVFDSFDIQEPIRIISMVLGVLVTAIGAYNSFFNNKAFWAVYTMSTNELKKIQDDYEFYLAGKEIKEIELSVLEDFKKQIQEVLDKINEEWYSIRRR